MLSLMLPRKSINRPKPQKQKPSVDEQQPKSRPKPLAKLFKKSSSRRASSISSSNTEASHPHTTLDSPPLPVEGVSVWNAAGQDIRTLQQRNTSTSNLSSTSTLLELPATRPALPHSPVRQSGDSYEAFLSHAQDMERRRHERDSMMAQAWLKAEERRRASRSWPSDPWRGGFGPPASDARYGGAGAFSPRRVSSGEDGVRGWLGRNGLVGR
ncbi:uncharacterized protein LY89DRAFT_742085 [Mollisia scopiformis]|uniref:Uncharacterized protein n=1 Tax=Mollisia scopiformis TaxID=149040 RepID=A0A132B996_MOLSC|nr:uncharacterized protein LY89DRAFT_742085 [Mollisia scopiformis]KUJ08247.1 hypothetical protein LY89DRAFT_742085 [Mollisia scopiformis]